MQANHEDIQIEVARLIEELNSKNRRRREQARRILLLIGNPAVEPLLDLLRQLRPPRTWKHPLMLLLTGSYFSLLVALIMGKVPHIWWIYLTFVGIAAVITIAQMATRTQIVAAHMLAQMEDIRAVGPLAEALEYYAIRTVVAKALTRLLPRLKAGDAALLNERQRLCLSQQLLPARRTNRNLVLVILSALEQIGDGSAIPYVKPLAERTGPYAQDKEVRAAAQNCLLFLQQQAESNRAQQTLLRPIAPTSDGKSTLLRPGSERTEVKPRDLLRALNAPDEAQQDGTNM